MKLSPTPFVPNRAIGSRTEKTSANDRVTTFVCEAQSSKSLVQDVRTCLSEDLRKPAYRDNPNPIAGHCYVASEVLYHKMGGKAAGWTPQTIQHEGGPHWFIKNKEGVVIDPTADQFETKVPYEEGRGCGFLTRQPSARSQVVLDRLGQIA